MKNLLLVFACFLSLNCFGTHLSGAWIEADVINANLLKVRIKMVASCGIPNITTSQTVEVSTIPSGSSSTPSVSHALPFMYTIYPDNYCNGVITACFGGTLNNYKIWVYEGFVPVTNNSVRIAITPFCCRPFSANVSTTFNIAAYTDVFLVNSIQNSSPQKKTYDVFSKLADTNTTDLSFIDQEADSLDYKLSQPLQNSNPITNAVFNSGFSTQKPFGLNQFTQLNTSNGHLKFVNSNVVGYYGLAYDVNEYRNGQLLSKIHSEFEVIVDGTISNSFYFSANGDLNKTFKPCKSDTVNYIVNFNLNDSIIINIDSITQYPGAVLNIINVNPTQKKAQFIWQPPYSSISLATRPLVFEVTKYACPYKKRLQYITKYKIEGCASDSVWPGDINTDKTANLIDAIYLAVAYNATGSPRLNPSINWNAQFANDWANNFNSAGNYKHADCDGDGIVQINDALAITQNFNLVHAKQAPSSNNNSNKIASTIYDPELNFGAASFTGTGSNVSVPISIGGNTKTVLGTNAILFKVNANPAIINANSLVFIPNTGIISNLNDIIVVQQKVINSGDLYIAFVKKNNGSFSGFGNLGTFQFQIKNNATLGNTNLSINQTNLFGPNMMTQPIKAGPDKTLNVVLNSDFNTLNDKIKVFPNPFKNKFNIQSEQLITKYEVIDVSGKIISIQNVSDKNFEVSLENLEQGFYFLRLHDNLNKVVVKLIKE